MDQMRQRGKAYRDLEYPGIIGDRFRIITDELDKAICSRHQDDPAQQKTMPLPAEAEDRESRGCPKQADA